MKRLLFLLVIQLLIHSCRSKTDFILTPLQLGENSSLTEVALGKKLFFDKRLSINNSVSCASCHNPNFGFTDRLQKSIGVYGRQVHRNSPTILNSAFSPVFMFDAHIKSLEEQAIVPIQEHTEMGIEMRTLIRKLRRIPLYRKAAHKLYHREFDSYVLTRSIAAFERSLLSLNSRFDRFYYKGMKNELNADEIKGWELFSEKLQCIQCHTLPYFTNFKAMNNGFYKMGEVDKGRFRIYGDSSDIGKFKVPSLRNIELTYPYMHNGKIKKLIDVINHYQTGGNNTKNKSQFIKPFELSQQEVNQLLCFLGSLTDTSYLARLNWHY